MHLIAFGDNPLGHVVDKAIIGGENPIFVDTVSATPSLTMHMVSLIVAGLIFMLMMLYVGKRIGTGDTNEGN